MQGVLNQMLRQEIVLDILSFLLHRFIGLENKIRYSVVKSTGKII